MKNTLFDYPKLTSKLAVLLMALPVSGAFAAYDYVSAVSAYDVDTSTVTFLTNDVKPATLNASGLAKVGTASDTNDNYIGWTGTPARAITLYWNLAGLSDTAGTLGDINVGDDETVTSTSSSCYNTLTVADYITIHLDSVAVGDGAFDDDNILVDATKPANYNTMTVTGAAYSAAEAKLVPTTLALEGVLSIGELGNHNTLKILDGAKVTADNNLLIGLADVNNLTYGCNNSVVVSGSVSASVLGYTETAPSTLKAKGMSLGSYGSNNSLTLADKAVADISGGPVLVGAVGDNNSLSISGGASLTANGMMVFGYMPDSTGNTLTLNKATLTHASASYWLTIGEFGSNNSLTATDSTISSKGIIVGNGDYASGDAAVDGTKGYVASEGNGNTLLVKDSLLKLTSSLYIGLHGSNNTGTISGSGLYSAWTDAGSTPDGKVQHDEISTGIHHLSVGIGRVGADSPENYLAFGSNNALTIDDASAFKVTTDIMVGEYGSRNSLSVKDGSVGSAANLFIGNGCSDNAAFGCNNSVTLTGEGTKLTTSSSSSYGVYLGLSGSNNKMVVSAGATFAAEGVDNVYIGYGFESTASADNSAFGCGNSLIVTGEGSSASITSTKDVILGCYGSNNKIEVSDKAKLKVLANLTIGEKALQFGTVLAPKNIYSQGNQIAVSGGATLTVTGSLTVGAKGIKNSLTVTGEDSYLEVSAGSASIGAGDETSILFGSGNSVTVSNKAVFVARSINVGAYSTGWGASDNSLTIENGAIVVARSISLNNTAGANNVLKLKNGMLALEGKGPYLYEHSWEEIFVTGFTNIDAGYHFPESGFIDAGAIQVWDANAGKYVTAKASDISLKYYSSETEAKAATGYTGLAGYTIVTQSNDLSRLAWAGDVYDAGNGSYCSSWYGWFYNDAAYGDYIMSYNNYAWQYVTPSSTPQDTYLYDYSLNTWLYTNSTYFQNKWFYNYTTKEWVQLGK
jgi:hypothetical protein